MSDYLPRTDAQLIAWMNVFMTYATANTAALGLVAADVTALQNQVTGLNTAFGNANNARQQARTATQTKVTTRRAAEVAFRAAIKKLQANTALTDAQKQGLGITVKDARPTVMSAQTLGGEVSRPLALVDNSRQLIHRVRYAQEGQPTRRAKPDGVRGCEMRMVILAKEAAVPDDPEAMKSLGIPTSSPYEVKFAAADAGKMAWYRLRWTDSSNSPVGEWSRPVSAMIVG